MIPRTQVADDAGALLVRSGLVSSSALDDARLRVLEHGGTVGEQLVASNVVTDEALTEFYRQRLLVPLVNPNSLARLSSKIIALIPGDLAIELRVVPVSLDSDNNLTVAMSDPSDRHAVDEIGFFTSAYVVRAVATQMQIAWCLAHYYNHVTALGERLLKPETPAAAAPTRKKGITDQVKALRTKRVERGAVMISDVMAELGNTGDATKIQPTTSEDEPTPVETRAKPRARTASGEIKVPKRAPSIKPSLPDDSGPVVMEIEAGEPSGPVITMEASSRDSEPVITIEATPPWTEDETVRKSPKPRRKRPADPDPPELAARAGEVQLATGQPVKAIDFDVPSIMISDELERVLRPSIAGELKHREPTPDPVAPPSATISVEVDGTDGAAVIREGIHDERSEPVLLERRRTSDAPTNTQINAASAAPDPENAAEDELSDVVVLELKKPSRRIDRITQVGIGPVTAATSARFEEMAGVPPDYDDAPTDARRVVDPDPTRVDTHVAPAAEDYTSSSDEVAPPPAPAHGTGATRDTLQVPVVPPPKPAATPPPSGAVSFENVKRAPTSTEDDDDDVKTRPTAVMSAVELDDVIPGRMSDPMLGAKRAPVAASGELDDSDGWGPPGTTIPPPLLGAIPGAIDTGTSGMIPIPNMDSAPLMVAPPSPPESMSRPRTASEQGASRVLEESTARVLELIRTLDHAAERDQIIAVMIAHLAESHQRAGFFAARNGELSLFAIAPRVPAMPTAAALRLDRASTLQDVVGTRLPYRGPMHDDASRMFLQTTLGACPPELLLVPIAVRERVVGVLFGDHRVRHTFDDQLALAARAAGMALERILKSRRG